jgi:DNA-binding NtrC family response regulator
MARILVVDDEVRMATLIRRELEDHGHDVVTAGDGSSALEQLSRGTFDLLLTDLRMPGMDGLDLLREARKVAPGTEVVLMTAYASAQTAVQAMKSGAYDYLIKPFEMDELLIMVDRVTEQERLRLENRQLRRQVAGEVSGLVGTSQAMRSVLDLVAKVAPQEATVLLSGESGTGKELVARAIHAASPRADGPLVAVNCAAIPETLLEAELFGHEKGAFTGADGRRLGRFELARKGTVFLDEVVEMSLQAQVKLLRVLQERVVERLGGAGTVQVDVRVIAATNRDLGGAVAEGGFREDLFYRLNVFPIHLPPLRERREDIALLARHFLERYGPGRELTPEAIAVLDTYHWPGNVRELENVIERSTILSGSGNPIGPEHLAMPSASGVPGAHPGRGGGRSIPGDVTIPESGIDLEDLERQHILEALRRSEGNKTEAARLLKMSRRRLYSRMKHHEIDY